MPTERRAFFFDVDNTLIDNDAAKVELRLRLAGALGTRETARFWSLYEAVRHQQGYVNIPLTLDRFATERDASPEPMSTAERAVLAGIFSEFPYADFLFADSLRVIAELRCHGQVAILSDGDPVFQPRKIWRAGLLAAVDGAAMVFTDKVRRLREAAAFYPADHYVLVDDKPAVLLEARRELGPAVTTVHVEHGQYAAAISDEAAAAIDIRLRAIGELPAALGLSTDQGAPAGEPRTAQGRGDE
jgi:FMN phosphatase YigB (HAD superfamily)